MIIYITAKCSKVIALSQAFSYAEKNFEKCRSLGKKLLTEENFDTGYALKVAF